MKWIFLFVFALFSLMSTANAQPFVKGHLNKSKPTVYLKYVSRSDAKVVQGEREPARLWFRLHNNSRWKLKVFASGGIRPNLSDVSLFYDIIGVDEKIQESIACRVCSLILINPGRSVLFNILEDHLIAGRQVRVSFNFEWEDAFGITNGDEPKHFVYFAHNEMKFPK